MLPPVARRSRWRRRGATDRAARSGPVALQSPHLSGDGFRAERVKPFHGQASSYISRRQEKTGRSNVAAPGGPSTLRASALQPCAVADEHCLSLRRDDPYVRPFLVAPDNCSTFPDPRPRPVLGPESPLELTLTDSDGTAHRSPMWRRHLPLILNVWQSGGTRSAVTRGPPSSARLVRRFLTESRSVRLKGRRRCSPARVESTCPHRSVIAFPRPHAYLGRSQGALRSS